MRVRTAVMWSLLIVVGLATGKAIAQTTGADSKVSAKVTLWDGKVVPIPDVVRVALVTEIMYATPKVEPKALRNLRFKSEGESREHVAFSSIRRADFGKPVSSGTDPEQQTLALTMLDGSVRNGHVAITLKETTEGFLDGDDVSMKRLQVALLHLGKVKSIEFSGVR